MDDAGVDKRDLAQVQNQVLSIFEKAINLIAEVLRVRHVKLSLEAKGDDLIRFGSTANGSNTVL